MRDAVMDGDAHGSGSSGFNNIQVAIPSPAFVVSSPTVVEGGIPHVASSDDHDGSKDEVMTTVNLLTVPARRTSGDAGSIRTASRASGDSSNNGVSNGFVTTKTIVVDKREEQITELLFYQSENDILTKQIAEVEENIRKAKGENAAASNQTSQLAAAKAAPPKQAQGPEENRIMRREVARKQRELNHLRKLWWADRDAKKGHGPHEDGPEKAQVEKALRMLIREVSTNSGRFKQFKEAMASAAAEAEKESAAALLAAQEPPRTQSMSLLTPSMASITSRMSGSVATRTHTEQFEQISRGSQADAKVGILRRRMSATPLSHPLSPELLSRPSLQSLQRRKSAMPATSDFVPTVPSALMPLRENFNESSVEQPVERFQRILLAATLESLDGHKQNR